MNSLAFARRADMLGGKENGPMGPAVVLRAEGIGKWIGASGRWEVDGRRSAAEKFRDEKRGDESQLLSESRTVAPPQLPRRLTAR